MKPYESRTDVTYPVAEGVTLAIGDPIRLDAAHFAIPVDRRSRAAMAPGTWAYVRRIFKAGDPIPAFEGGDAGGLFLAAHVVVTYLAGLYEAEQLGDALRVRGAWSTLRRSDGHFHVFIGRVQRADCGPPAFGEGKHPTSVVEAYLAAFWQFDVEPKTRRGVAVVFDAPAVQP